MTNTTMAHTPHQMETVLQNPNTDHAHFPKPPPVSNGHQNGGATHSPHKHKDQTEERTGCICVKVGEFKQLTL